MKWVECNKKQFLADIQGKQVVCFGSGELGMTVLQELNIRESVRFFCDNDSTKWGTRLRVAESDYPICSPAALSDVDWNTTVLLVTNAYYFKEIQKQLDAIEILDSAVGYIYWNFRFAIYPGTEDFFEERILKPSLKWYEYHLKQKNVATDAIQQLVKAKEEFMRGDEFGRPLVVPRIVFRITTYCSLNCKDCLQLIPLFVEKGKCQHFDKASILQDMKVFLDSVDECICTTVCGGEPMMYPYLDELLEYLIQSPKTVSVEFETNGTILPSDKLLKLCQNEKVIVRMSDYGDIVKMTNALARFEEYGVYPDIFTDMVWREAGNPVYQEKDEETMRREYLRCDCSVNAKGILGGKLYNCNRAEMHDLLGEYNSDADYVELKEEFGLQENRLRIRNMFDRDYCYACHYCNSGMEKMKVIPPAIQVGREPVNRSSYTIVSREKYEELMKR